MAGDTVHVVENPRFKTTFIVDLDELDTVEDVDVFVDMPDGSRFMATAMTLDSIAGLLRKWRLTGECLGGTFFTCPDLVVVRERGVPAMIDLIGDLSRGTDDRLQDVFQELVGDGEGGFDDVAIATPPVERTDSPRVVETDQFAATFMLDDGTDAATASDVGAVIELADGSRWAARYMTIDAIGELLQRRQLTGEHLGGRYFHDWNLVVVSEPGVPAMTELIRRQVDSDEEPISKCYRRLP